MPSNDERRQVAARLRDYAKRDFEESNPWWYLSKAMTGSFAAYDEVGEYFTDLADLIEPEPERTCRIVGMDCAGNPPYNKSGLHLNSTACGCSECGYPFNWCRSLIQARNEVVACPNCGAKVVE